MNAPGRCNFSSRSRYWHWHWHWGHLCPLGLTPRENVIWLTLNRGSTVHATNGQPSLPPLREGKPVALKARPNLPRWQFYSCEKCTRAVLKFVSNFNAVNTEHLKQKDTPLQQAPATIGILAEFYRYAMKLKLGHRVLQYPPAPSKRRQSMDHRIR
jgi:hypothetical protein